MQSTLIHWVSNTQHNAKLGKYQLFIKTLSVVNEIILNRSCDNVTCDIDLLSTVQNHVWFKKNSEKPQMKAKNIYIVKLLLPIKNFNSPIIIGIPWVWKWCNKSRPLARISAPVLTNIIFDVTPRRCSKHILTSNEPIHCREPTNSSPLSWRSTSACWISRWLGTGLDV